MTTEAKLFRIKPLEWRHHRYDYQEFYAARGFLGEYLIVRWFDLNKHEWGEWKLKLQHEQGAYAAIASPEAGKQIAEQHWQEYIKQALIEVE